MLLGRHRIANVEGDTPCGGHIPKIGVREDGQPHVQRLLCPGHPIVVENGEGVRLQPCGKPWLARTRRLQGRKVMIEWEPAKR